MSCYCMLPDCPKCGDSSDYKVSAITITHASEAPPSCNGAAYQEVDGSWNWECRIQDGTERGIAANEEEAIKHVRDVERHMNGKHKFKKKWVPVYRAQHTVKTEYVRVR